MSRHEPTEAIISADPHPAFERVAAVGYRLDHHHAEGSMAALHAITIRALADGRVVAVATFQDDGSACHCQDVRVDDAHQRRGLATAMYLLAERVLRKPLFDFWDGHKWQSPAAKAMWANPDRPFGKPHQTSPA